MDKTHNISLGGFAFIIEENAFSSLRRYLDEIHLYLKNDEGKQEIINDIEYRMAEILGELLKKNRQVVNIDDINHIKRTLGEPAQFILDEDEVKKTPYSFTFPFNSKKLYRDPSNKKLGGVAAGLAHYFNVSPSLVRIILLCLPFLDFLFLGISSSSVILAYVILWIVIPKALTTAEKLEMHGDHVNVDSLRSFNRVIPDSQKINTSLEVLIKRFLKPGLKIVIAFISFLLLIAGVALAISVITALFGGGFALFDSGLFALSLPEFLPLLFEDDWAMWVFYPSLLILVFIPIIGVILVLIRIFSSRFRIKKEISYTLISLFFIGLISFSVVCISTLRAFQRSAVVTEYLEVPTSRNEILMIENLSPDEFDHVGLTYSFSPLEFVPSLDSLTQVEITKTAKGKSLNQAKKHANFKSSIRIKPNKIQFKNIASIYAFEKWRFQNEKIVIQIPEGQKIQFKNVSNIITDRLYNTAVKNNTVYIFENNRLYTESEWNKKSSIPSAQGSTSSYDSLIQNSSQEIEINKNRIYIHDEEDSDIHWD